MEPQACSVEKQAGKGTDATSYTWHDASHDALTARLASKATSGLSVQASADRLAQTGPNELRKGEVIAPLAILLSQFRSLVIWVLIGAALMPVLLGELADGIAVIAIWLRLMYGCLKPRRCVRMKHP